MIIETVQASAARTTRFSVSGFPNSTLHVWSTDLTSTDPSQWFAKQADISVTGGMFSLYLLPGHMYSVTTTTGQGKGDAASPPPTPFQLPYADNFDSYRPGALARYFSDMYGAFETAKCDGGRTGICLSQLTPEEPIAWKKTSGRPFTILGNLDWTDYTVSADVLFEQPGSVDIIGRLTGMSDRDVPNSYVLRVSDAGAWSVLKTAVKGDDVVLASGTVAALGLKHWHKLAIGFAQEKTMVSIDGKLVKEVADNAYIKGMVGLGAVNYVQVQFDNFKVASRPDFTEW